MKQYHQHSLLKLPEVIGDAKKGLEPLIPVSQASFLQGVREGKYPRPVRIAAKSVAWRYTDIIKCIEGFQYTELASDESEVG